MEKQIHDGHRERLRQKIRKFGINAMPEHEVLELLLTYAIPRKDTNKLAHILLNTFGSLANVLDAEPLALTKIKGIGKEAALFLSMLPNLFSMYRQNKLMRKKIFLKNINDCVKFFRANYEVERVEKFYAVCLNDTGKVVKTYEFSGNDSSSVAINLKRFISNVSDDNISCLLLFHTHPDGTVAPSQEDISTTQEIYTVCRLLGIDLADHIIFNETEHFSLGKTNFMDNISLSFNSNFKNDDKTVKQRSIYSYIDTLENSSKVKK